MKAKKSKVFYELMPIYDRHVFYGNDPVEIKKMIQKAFKPSEVDLDDLDEYISISNHLEGFCLGLNCNTEPERLRCFVLYVDDTVEDWVVAHEAIHLKNMIYDYLLIQPDVNNDEPEAYLLEHIVKQFMVNIRGHKEKNRRRINTRKKDVTNR